MKNNSPLLMGIVIFSGHLLMQAVVHGASNVDIYRSAALAILSGIIFFVISPLFGIDETFETSKGRALTKNGSTHRHEENA